MRALVVGQGSIGRRHSRLLAELGCSVSVVSRHLADGTYPRFRSLAEALEAGHPEYVVVASETSAHLDAIEALAAADFTGLVLVEKPLFHRQAACPKNRFARAAVAYNLRFHPLLQEFSRRLNGRRILAVEAYVGQWLPDWRPGIDYRASYSARKAEGGGALRDLSHEIDLLQWLFGDWTHLAAIGGHRSDLQIDSDDLWTVLFEFQTGASATLHLNYLDRPGRRRLTVITSDTTFLADLSASTLWQNGQATHFDCGRDDTYRAQHLAMIGKGGGSLCPIDDGRAVLDTIAAIEDAAAHRRFNARRGSA